MCEAVDKDGKPIVTSITMAEHERSVAAKRRAARKEKKKEATSITLEVQDVVHIQKTGDD